jgi:hypothetical protein
MACARKAVLYHDHKDASAKMHAALKRLDEQIGTCSREQYASLKSEADAAWQLLDYARSMLDAHIRRHGC